MRSEVIPILKPLPADATFADAVAWAKRMRRLLERAHELPAGIAAMPLEVRQCALEEIAQLEQMLQPQGAIP